MNLLPPHRGVRRYRSRRTAPLQTNTREISFKLYFIVDLRRYRKDEIREFRTSMSARRFPALRDLKDEDVVRRCKLKPIETNVESAWSQCLKL